MLSEIYIENIALVTKLRLQLGAGFNVLTGETGAGKSILLDAMALILGAKADSQLIRHGTDKALVEGVFNNFPKGVQHLKQHYGVDGDELILTREIAQGRSICRINGRTFPLNVLREFGEKLVNIYGQHDFQTLLKPENHLNMLDTYLPEINAFKNELSNCAKHIINISKELKNIEIKAQEVAKEADFLSFQAKEIDDAKLNAAEEDEILNRQKLLSNAEKIITALSSSYQLLYGGQNHTASEQITCAIKEISSVSDCSQELQSYYDRLFDLSAQIDDIARELKNYMDILDYNPQELEELEDRIYIIKSLKRKYGITITDILEYRENIEKKLNVITYRADNEAHLNQELYKYQAQYDKLAMQLSTLRCQAATSLEEKITAILTEMNMNAQIQVKFTPREGYYEEGREQVEFYIKTNAGEAFKPIVKIASGGELARLMLAMRTVLNSADPVPTLVFDEVDAGMGGVTLSKVAAKLNKLSENAQILCVTHSAQLAAKAKFHYLVKKEEKDNKTFTTVEPLNKNLRIEEIARMLDGQITHTSVTHAEELLKV